MGKKVVVYADETRPFLQGSRLTAFEMMEEGIECYIITDGMSGWLMETKQIDAVLVGCDRVAKMVTQQIRLALTILLLLPKHILFPFMFVPPRIALISTYLRERISQ